MADLKLAKLPDRTPVKHTITVSPDLNRRLAEYAEAYNQTYADGDPETVTELIPYMLQTFLDSDKGFARTRKQKRRESGDAKEPARTPQMRRRQNGDDSSSNV